MALSSSAIDVYYHESAVTKFAAYEGSYSLRLNDTTITYYNISANPRTVNGLYTTGYNYSYPYTFQFEETFDTYFYVDWMSQYHWVSNLFIAAYLAFIYLMRRYMSNRPRFELRGALVIWNIILAIFSLGGTIRTLPETFYVLNKYGFQFCVCYSGKP